MFEYEREHLERIRYGLSECTLFLKKNDDFPLSKPCDIALFGSGARKTLKGGTGSGEVNSHFFINIEDGLKGVGFNILSGNWLDKYDKITKRKEKEFIKNTKKEARKRGLNPVIYGMGKVMLEPDYNLTLGCDCDTAIYVLSRICGEGNDRENVKGDFQLTDTEIKDIKYLNKNYRKFMLVLNVGGPIDLSPILEVKNILLLSQLGVETGYVLANIILGKENPSGKLTTTWARFEDYCPDIEFGDRDNTHYYEGIFVGYKYFDSAQKTPLFPFGFGLSYTDFTINFKNLEISKSIVHIDVDVKNIGNFDGKEVVQIYLSCPSKKLQKPYQTLVAFRKTKTLKPNEVDEINIDFDLKEIASYDEELESYILESGKYIVRIGNASNNTKPVLVINLKEDVITKKVKNILPKNGFIDKEYLINKNEDLSKIKTINMFKDNLTYEKIEYDYKEEVIDEAKSLSIDNLTKLCLGAFDVKGGFSSVIGTSAKHVAGGGGESFSINSIPYITMADGPAGLRLTREYYLDKNNNIHPLNETGIPESIARFTPGIFKFLMKFILPNEKKAPKGIETKYQYCISIPIGTAIAQSWNEEFAKTCGDVVGEEMEQFGVNLWLAPALNIHRSVLCGRNFEYYSEDPILSGVMAANITLGVQKHEGCGTTIKHFTANNQELNRMSSNSIVSERTMREIYLKSFEIAIKKSNPYALMTSYNLLNGIHTSQNRPLIIDYLRCECKYEGLIMTDWLVQQAAEKNNKFELATASKILKSGVNIVMPGTPNDYEDIKSALNKNNISRFDLEKCASKVAIIAKNLNKVK